MDLADAPLVILAEELGRGHILSTDLRDSLTYSVEKPRALPEPPSAKRLIVFPP